MVDIFSHLLMGFINQLITGGAPSCRDGDFDDFELGPSTTKAWNRRVTPYIQNKYGSVIPPFLSLCINIIIVIIYYYYLLLLL